MRTRLTTVDHVIPDSYHDFFLGTAGVAGALIGLLFVAISVNEDQVGEQGAVTMRFRPSTALSAFLNALLISLLALIPELQIANAILTMAILGLITMITHLVVLVIRRAGTETRELRRSIIAVVGQAVIYLFQLIQATQLVRHPDDLGSITAHCVILIVLFAIGIERAWEFVGAKTPGLISTLLRARQSAEADPTEHSGDGNRPDEDHHQV